MNRGRRRPDRVRLRHAGPHDVIVADDEAGRAFAALFQDTPRAVSFTASTALAAGVSGGAVTVDGVPITGPSAPMAIQSGALAGLATLRDTVAPEYQAQLDQIAGGFHRGAKSVCGAAAIR